MGQGHRPDRYASSHTCEISLVKTTWRNAATVYIARHGPRVKEPATADRVRESIERSTIPPANGL